MAAEELIIGVEWMTAIGQTGYGVADGFSANILASIRTSLPFPIGLPTTKWPNPATGTSSTCGPSCPASTKSRPTARARGSCLSNTAKMTAGIPTMHLNPVAADRRIAINRASLKRKPIPVIAGIGRHSSPGNSSQNRDR